MRARIDENGGYEPNDGGVVGASVGGDGIMRAITRRGVVDLSVEIDNVASGINIGNVNNIWKTQKIQLSRQIDG